MARVVVVEPFYGGSHRAWADGWARTSRHEITLVTHEGEFWRWRMRGGAVTLAAAFDAHVAATGRPDVVVVSGMVDVAAFAGLARRALGDVPVAVYCHESQLLYPPIPDKPLDMAAVFANWQSLVAAQAVWFNSEFHRAALREVLPGFLRTQPDPNHAYLVEPVFERSRVLCPGVEVQPLIAARRSLTSTPNVLWNQRWDHDKNPYSVFAALADLAQQGVAFTLALAGQNQRPDRADFVWVHERLGERIVHSGYADEASYRELLVAADVVVSATDHEFFGIAVVEAIAAGAVPVLPDRLSFPELIEARWHDAVLYPDGELRTRLAAVLADLDGSRRRVEGLRESMMRFDWSIAAAAHDRAVDDLAALASR